MSIRNLDYLFDPASVAVVGASLRPGSVGSTVWRNLTAGAFAGPLYAVNPKYHEIDGRPVLHRLQDLPTVPELAVICSPTDTVAGLVAQLAALGTRAAVLLTPGLSEEQKSQVREAAKPQLLRILGPDCIGMLSPILGLNASLAHINAIPGDLAFVSQSVALSTAVLDWACTRGIGFSHFVSLGEMLDVDFGDMLDYLASDPKTRAILLHMETMDSPRKFMSAARAAARNKPVIVVKAGRAKPAQAGTPQGADPDRVCDAAIARAGMLRVDTLQQLFMAAETLARFRTNNAETLTIVSNGAGAGVLAVDAAEQAGIELSALSPATLSSLDSLLPPTWSHGNPVDILGDAPAQRYLQALEVLAKDPAAGAMLVLHAPTALVSGAQVAQALLPLATQQPPRLMGCWLGGDGAREARQVFQNANVACYSTPEQAVRAFAFGVTYRRNQAQLLEAPPATRQEPVFDSAAVRELVQQALEQGREVLSELESREVLAAYGIAVVPTRRTSCAPEDAAQACAGMRFPVVLKVLSGDIRHKSEVGGVALNLHDSQAVHAEALSMMERLKRVQPDARIEGFTLQSMVRRSRARELLIGASIDSVFGPVIVFGHGGKAADVIADLAVALPPLNLPLARALVQRTRVCKLLQGFRGTPSVDLDALYGVLVAVSRLLADVPQIAELEINPLLADHEGVLALDAHIRLSAAAPAGALNFAIRPYPSDLVETFEWKGRPLTLRPIRPEDEAQHLAFLGQLSPEDIRMRVFYSRRSIERSELARLTQIDYAREMAFVAVAPDPQDEQGAEQTLGVVRAVADPDNIAAEFGVIIRSDLKGGGLGRILMDKLIRYARANGTQRLVGTVIAENQPMLELARDLGFVQTHVPQGSQTCEVALELQ